MPVKFWGEAKRGTKSVYYDWNHNANSKGITGNCGGWANDLIHGRKCSHFGDNEATWGYAGHGPDIMSVSLLAWSLDNAFVKAEFIPGMNHYNHKDREKILKLYPKFTKEVVSKLPDRWTMTSDEVLAWIKDGTLPACIKQTK